MEFDTDRSTVFKIFNKKTKQWERKEFVADPVMIIHTINAFEDAKGNIKDLFIKRLEITYFGSLCGKSALACTNISNNPHYVSNTVIGSPSTNIYHF